MLALLEPIALLRQYEDEGKYFQRLALQEEAKSLPWGAVWDMYCLQSGVPVGESYIAEIEKYELPQDGNDRDRDRVVDHRDRQFRAE